MDDNTATVLVLLIFFYHLLLETLKIDKLVNGIANEEVIVLQEKRNTVVVPGHNISYIVVDK
ncbi:hypothetical protein [Streptococcus uberis]|uniref:hypothetical protein n=1 Tax=Streptococcus uberis TaxID=1349 RepID=UPI001939FC00|nr:hypothetical protein [Streptococcus uberis]